MWSALEPGVLAGSAYIIRDFCLMAAWSLLGLRGLCLFCVISARFLLGLLFPGFSLTNSSFPCGRCKVCLEIAWFPPAVCLVFVSTWCLFRFLGRVSSGVLLGDCLVSAWFVRVAHAFYLVSAGSA